MATGNREGGTNMMCLAWKVGTPCGNRNGLYDAASRRCPDVDWFWWLSGIGAAMLAFKKYRKGRA